ncbi:hypothetical protein SAMN05216456_1463 [Devosia crocina]|uniref:Uncharacterized protein n=1 Tax=Devosia crocina TaxID=429728 RepID=A0A1I7NAZ6_9HYPH|nr:hypothetical protein [Devosia crocina]SFV31801.1 hypothetical protein SAMN05216456_1463 [Devosia crocina]
MDPVANLGNLLGGIANLPFVRPFGALLLSIVSAWLSWTGNGEGWRDIILAIAVALAVWTFLEAQSGTMRGFVVGLFAFQISTGLTTIGMMSPTTPQLCIMTPGEDMASCAENLGVHHSAISVNPS